MKDQLWTNEQVAEMVRVAHLKGFNQGVMASKERCEKLRYPTVGYQLQALLKEGPK